jgi:hypothetical protein
LDIILESRHRSISFDLILMRTPLRHKTAKDLFVTAPSNCNCCSPNEHPH